MRKWVLIFNLLLASKLTLAQTFTVGDTSCNYQIVNRKFSVTCTHPPMMSVSVDSDSLEIDVDGDLNKDLKVVSYCIWTPGGSSNTSTYYLKVVSLTNVEYAYKNPTSNGCSYSSTVANLSFGTPLNSSLTWSVSPPTSSSSSTLSSYLYYSFSSPISGLWWCGNSGPFYMGVRKIITGDTISGWVLLNSGTPGSVKSYAFKHSAGNSTITPVFTSTVNEVCYSGTVALAGNPSGGIFNGAGVTGNVFNSVYTGPGVHNVYYTNGCSTPAVKTITVHSPAIDFTNTQTVVCSSYSLTLTANPFGGTFYGTNVSGNVFYPSSTGTTAISYSVTDAYGCSSTKTLAVNSLTAPILNVSSTSSLSCPGESVALLASGAPNYTWSTGAQTASITINPISSTIYTVSGQFSGGSCPASSITFTQFVGNPTVTISANSTMICPGSNINLWAYGAANYTWSTGSTATGIVTSPTVSPTTYSVIGVNSGGCSGTATISIAIATKPTVTVSSSSSVSCSGQPVTLFFNGSGYDYIWVYDSITGNHVFGGTSSNSLNVIPDTSITYLMSVYYGQPNTSCNYNTYFHQDVVTQNKIISAIPSKTFVCNGDTITLSLSGSKSYTVTDGSVTYTTNTSTLIFSPLSISYLYTVYGDSIVSGCQAVGHFTLGVSSCVGIMELNKENDQFRIYPNPNNGEFEIKGIKEEAIYISDELGQIVGTKYLNSQNNYSVKIKNLQNGIYFVGNKFSRQKVVVIK